MINLLFVAWVLFAAIVSIVVSKNVKWNENINKKSGFDLDLKALLNAFDEASDGIAIMDEKGNIKYANKNLWNIYAIERTERKEYIGQSWLKLHSSQGQKQIIENVLPALESKGLWFGETDVKIKSGALIRAELSINRIDNGHLIGIIRDVSERHKQMQERENLLTQIHQTQKSEAIGRVLRGLVHDFNNTLSSISGYSELLLEDLQPATTHYEYAERIFKSSQQTKRVLEQARMLLPQRPGKDQISDIVKALDDCVNDHRDQSNQVSLDNKLTSASISLSERKLKILISHLIQNARDACLGCKDVKITIGLNRIDAAQSYHMDCPVPRIEKISHTHSRLSFGTYDPTDEYVLLQIADNGTGMKYEILDHIFDPFFTTKKAESSSGMGMSIVQSLLKSIQSRIEIETVEGHGTSIQIFLKAVPGTITTNEGHNLPLAKGNIVLVDDQEMVRKINKIMLEQYGYKVFDFVSPYDALDFIETHPEEFQYVFTDLDMSDMDGIEFSRTLYDRYPKLPVMLVTGYDEIKPDLPLNIREVLYKPVSKADLSRLFTRLSTH